MRRLQIAAGVTFVSAWIVGLVLAASGPKPTDTASKITGYFAAHEHTAMVAHFLIDGAAGLAIVAIAYSLYRYLASSQNGLVRLLLWTESRQVSRRSARWSWASS